MAILAWLFIRGGDSVRIVRDPEGFGLEIHGPGAEQRRHEFTGEDELLAFQGSLESRLSSEGWELRASHERRSGRDRRATSRGPDRRQRRSE